MLDLGLGPYEFRLLWECDGSRSTNPYDTLRCSTLEKIGSDSNLGLRVTVGLTFGPKPGAIDKG